MLCFVFFPTMWIVKGGTYGSMPYYLIINAGIISFLLIGRQRKIMMWLFAAVVGGLMIYEYRHPEIAATYSSPLVRYMDLSFGLFVCLISIAILIGVLIDGYMDELKKSRQYLAILEEKNREIEANNKRLEELNRLLCEEQQKLKQVSITDDLTGVFNKRFITSFFSGEVDVQPNVHKKLTVALLDIDNFKAINDTYGHLYGDEVIKKIASTIKSNLRQTDIVSRFGGDEFFKILFDTGKEEGYAIMERIRRKVAELEWDFDIEVTISGGVIEAESDEIGGLLNRVDELLYSAKNNKKNLIVIENSILPRV